MAELICGLGPDTCGTLLAGFVEATVSSLDAAVYEVGPSWGSRFRALGDRDVAVRLLLDGHREGNEWTVHDMRGHAPQCRILRHASGREAHWKLLVRDSDGVALGTGNLIERDAPVDRQGRLPAPPRSRLKGTREWWVLLSGAPLLAAAARARIDTAWEGATPPIWLAPEEAAAPWDVGRPHPQVAPLTVEVDAAALDSAFTGAGVRQLIEALLADPGRRVLVTAPYVHVAAEAVHDLLHRLTDLVRGRDVRLLLGGAPAAGDLAGLRSLGLETRVMDPRRSTVGHAKGVVAERSVLVMSSNLSGRGLSTNLECGLRIDEPAAADYYAAAFERDWEVASET